MMKINTENKIYDIIIVGFGPAGSAAAKFLGEQGYSILIIDKEKIGRNKPCGGGITARTIKKFPYLKDLMVSEIYNSKIYYKNFEEFIVRKEENPVGFNIRRSDFDKYHLELALKMENVEILENHKVTNINFDKTKIGVECNNGKKFFGKLLLGCDGVYSKIREKSTLNKYWKKDKRIFIFSSEIEGEEEELENFFGKNKTNSMILNFKKVKGYGWIFPGTTWFNIGFGGISKKLNLNEIKKIYLDFFNSCLDSGIIPKNSKLTKNKAFPVQMGGPMKKITNNRILLLGEAAGFVYPISGEGILYAIWSAKIASEVINSFFNNKISIENMYTEYESKCQKNFGKEQRIVSKMVKIGFLMGFLVFQLGRFDEKLVIYQNSFLLGEENYIKIIFKLSIRCIIGILKFNLWKK